MSLMRSYSYGSIHGVSELSPEILGLFSDLVTTPEKKIEYASEIISAGLQGRIRFQNFNLDAYEATIRKNERLGKESKRKKEIFLDTSDSSEDWDEVTAKGGIKPDTATVRAVNKMEDVYEKLLDDDELRFAVDTIKSLQQSIMVEAHVDIVLTIKQALRGLSDSISVLQKVCDEYAIVAEQVKTILGSGLEFEELFA